MRYFSPAAAVLCLPLLLAGCGGAAQDKPTAQDDAAWDQAMTAGRDSFELGRYTVAVTQYRKAADLALLRDDASAITEAGYDLAVAQLAANTPDKALQTAQATRQAAGVRGQTQLYSLDLVEAAAHYRLGHYSSAISSATQAMQSSDTALAGRAALVLGLAADAQSDSANLQKAAAYLGSLKKPLSTTQQADQAEIQARVLRQSAPQQAEALAVQAADLRRNDGSYRDMARALALAARIASAQGDQQKARALWERAAQSAAAQSSGLNRMDAQTLAHGSINKGNYVPPEDDAAAWARDAGGVSLRPFEDKDAQ
ncbi:hypothetical protein [Acetobacter pasteurianus]|uniref:hypothetical protein n=1 Tax=Acetobacter pasteurianus TaxID=438 RepID=UPI003D13C04C